MSYYVQSLSENRIRYRVANHLSVTAAQTDNDLSVPTIVPFAGFTYTDRSLPFSCAHIAWNGSVYIALSSGAPNLGVIAYSSDGSSWNTTNIGALSGQYGNEQYEMICAGYNNYIVGIDTTAGSTKIGRSNDGTSWTFPSGNIGSTWSAIAWNGSIFVISINSVSSRQTQVSSDGITWTTGANRLPSAGTWRSLAALGSTFIALSSGTTTAARSTDGVNWTSSTLPTSDWWMALKSNGSYVVGICDGSTVVKSSDGITWESGTMPTSGTWGALEWNGTYWYAMKIAATGANNAAYSADGINWTTETFNGGASTGTPELVRNGTKLYCVKNTSTATEIT